MPKNTKGDRIPEFEFMDKDMKDMKQMRKDMISMRKGIEAKRGQF